MINYKVIPKIRWKRINPSIKNLKIIQKQTKNSKIQRILSNQIFRSKSTIKRIYKMKFRILSTLKSEWFYLSLSLYYNKIIYIIKSNNCLYKSMIECQFNNSLDIQRDRLWGLIISILSILLAFFLIFINRSSRIIYLINITFISNAFKFIKKIRV